MEDHKEIIGTLISIDDSSLESSNAVLTFSCKKLVSVPKSFIDSTVHSLVNKKVGILNLYGNYYIKEKKIKE